MSGKRFTARTLTCKCKSRPSRPLAALRFDRLRRGDAGRLATPFPAGAPLDEVQTFRQGVPVIVAFGVAGNGKQLPIAVDFDLLDDIDVGHGFHLVG